MAPRKKMTGEEKKVVAEDEKKNNLKKEEEAKKTTSKKRIKQPVEREMTSTPVEEKAGPVEKVIEREKPLKQQSSPFASLDRGALILGGGLLFMGVLLLLGRLLSIPFGDYLWPFIFIVPGVLVLLTALTTESSSGEGLSILGSILTMLGVVFLVQSVTGFWASWAYVWALVAPTSIGIGQMLFGQRKDRDAIVQSGRRLVSLGLMMFAIGFVFFELIIGISGFGLAKFGLPVFPMILIFTGLIVLVRSMAKGR